MLWDDVHMAWLACFFLEVWAWRLSYESACRVPALCREEYGSQNEHRLIAWGINLQNLNCL